MAEITEDEMDQMVTVHLFRNNSGAHSILTMNREHFMLETKFQALMRKYDHQTLAYADHGDIVEEIAEITSKHPHATVDGRDDEDDPEGSDGEDRSGEGECSSKSVIIPPQSPHTSIADNSFRLRLDGKHSIRGTTAATNQQEQANPTPKKARKGRTQKCYGQD